MLHKTGRFHWNTLIQALKAHDPVCRIAGNAFADEFDIICTDLTITGGSPDTESQLGVIADAHDADAGLAVEATRKARQDGVPVRLRALTMLANASYTQVDTWVDTNFAQFSSQQRAFFRTLATVAKAYLDEKGIIE